MTFTLVVGAAPAAGADDFYRGLLVSANAVVAADAAGPWCAALGRTPDVIVGDFDSGDPDEIDRLERFGVCIERHPSDKDDTDLELAVRVARERWALPVCLTAAFSDRIDHTLAAIGVLLRAGTGAGIAEPSWRAWPCSPERPLSVSLERGTTYSIVALGPCEGVTARGGRWELSNATLAPLSGHGISNEAVGTVLTVRVRSGSLVVVANDHSV
ncbi:MAG TPA: thiamine diphosphokinase [Coriobacteriia bacterium]